MQWIAKTMQWSHRIIEMQPLRRVSPLTPRQQRMLDQARRWRVKGPGDRDWCRCYLREVRKMRQLARKRAARTSGVPCIQSTQLDSHWTAPQ